MAGLGRRPDAREAVTASVGEQGDHDRGRDDGNELPRTSCRKVQYHLGCGVGIGRPNQLARDARSMAELLDAGAAPAQAQQDVWPEGQVCLAA